ncbi:ABC transporter ATP-binding protein, partial [Roseateles sp. P5_E11]
SSLVRLLMRLYTPSSGRILVDGTPIDKMPAAQLRAQIGLVSQESLLLHATIADNIALGMPGTSQAEIEWAARGAQLHEQILAMPHGYDTQVGERGMQLSGGERQRVAIARALLRRPAIYVLDEPTSMLDSNTEAGILRTLQDVTAGCTTIVIAHRLSTVMHADEIIVMDGGHVRERGRHADLLAQPGLYVDLWARQLGKR